MAVYRRKIKDAISGKERLSKHYYCSYTLPNGTRKIKCTKKTTEKKAREWESDMIAKLNSIKVDKSIVQEFRDVLRDGIPLKIEDSWSKFAGHPDRPDCSPRTLREYQQQWNRFIGYLQSSYGEIEYLHQVTKETASNFMSDLWESGISENRYNKYKNLCSLVVSTLSGTIGIEPEENPFISFKSKKLRNSVSKEELSETQLRKVCEQTNGEIELQLLFALGMFTGMRLGDCARLRQSEVDLDRNVISRLPSKISSRTKQHVILPIHPELRSLMIVAIDRLQHEFLMPAIAEKYMTDPSGLSRRIQSIFRAAGIETQKQIRNAHRSRIITTVGFHSLRHSFVSICAKNNVPLSVVQNLIGHGNPAMTRHYTHIGEDSAAKAIGTLPALNGTKRIERPSDSQKISLVLEMLNDVPDLTERERRILGILAD